jgi:hypothetical protein
MCLDFSGGLLPGLLVLLAVASAQPSAAFVMIFPGGNTIQEQVGGSGRWRAQPVSLPDGSTGYEARVSVGVSSDFAQRLAEAAGFTNPTPEQLDLVWSAVDAAFRAWENGVLRFDVVHEITGGEMLAVYPSDALTQYFGAMFAGSSESGSHTLTNGEVVDGSWLSSAHIEIYFSTISGFLGNVGAMSEHAMALMLTRLLIHESGHSIGLAHPFAGSFIDSDDDPMNEMAIDPRDPSDGLDFSSGGYDDSAIMMRYGSPPLPLSDEMTANFTRTSLSNDDRGGRDVLYPDPRLPLCIPRATGVPGMGGPPKWWEADGRVDDPRWRGALVVGHANGHARFRALRASDASGATQLYLSWEVEVDPGGISDGVSVAFYDPLTQNGNAFQFTLKTDADLQGGTLGSGEIAFEGYYRKLYTPEWTQLAGAVPPWLDETTRSFVSCDAGACTWALQVRIPIDPQGDPEDPAQGVQLSNEFVYWHDLQVFGDPIVVHHSWPEWAPGEFPFATEPDVWTWERMQLEAGIPCRPTISLSGSQITTDHPEGSQIIGESNTFHARPTNHAGRTLRGDDVKARFRIANWGSAVGDSPEWRDVSPECSAASGEASSAVSDGANFDLECTWEPGDELCQYDPNCDGTYHHHQCILVELSHGGTAEPGLVFSPGSAYRNMEVVAASTFEREAVVSVSGLEAIEGSSQRDVYLLVETHNLPSPALVEAEGLEVPPATIDPKLWRQLAHGQVPLEEVERDLPTYVVHVFHETGATLESDGQTYTVVRPQPSFGYYVTHEGKLTGWEHHTQGASLEQLTDRLYRIAVPNGGQVRVNTAIAAVEPGWSPWWWIVLLLLVAAFATWILLRPTQN